MKTNSSRHIAHAYSHRESGGGGGGGGVKRVCRLGHAQWLRVTSIITEQNHAVFSSLFTQVNVSINQSIPGYRAWVMPRWYNIRT